MEYYETLQSKNPDFIKSKNEIFDEYKDVNDERRERRNEFTTELRNVLDEMKNDKIEGFKFSVSKLYKKAKNPCDPLTKYSTIHLINLYYFPL